MRFPSFAKAAAGLAFIMTVLAACTVVVEDGPDRPPPGPGGPPICTREYDPVCAERGRDRRTFGNACMARAEGYRIAERGECRRAGPPQACTFEYRPVCAVYDGQRRTFGNACQAEVEGFRVVREGECGAGGPGGGQSPGFCTREYDPVCARRGGSVRTFPNACEAESADYRIMRRGTC